jgi:hypothetical protein
LNKSKIALMHIPRTGGTALGSHLFHQTRADPTYFFSFFGLDSSGGANRVVVERLRSGDEDHRRLMANDHFLASRVVMGHFSRDLANVFDQMDFRFATVLREPVDRTISMIYKYTADLGDRCRFGELPVPSKSREPDAYWDEIHRILCTAGAGPIPGLLPHENTVMFDGMCHMVAGSPLHTYSPSVDFGVVERHLPTFRFGLFQRFNETVSVLLRHLDLPIVLDERTNYGGGGNPVDRAGHRPFYGAPAKVIALVRARNENDLRLYDRVASAGLEAATRPV